MTEPTRIARLRAAGPWLGVFALCTLLGCAETMVNVAPARTPGASVGALTTGSACGVMLFDLIPIALHDRNERAYKQAIETAGAGGLTDTSISSRWYYLAVGVLHCTDIQGTAVR